MNKKFLIFLLLVSVAIITTALFAATLFFISALISALAGFFVVYSYHSLNCIETAEYRIVKHTKICSTIEGETKFHLERKYNDNVFSKEVWEWQLSRDTQLEVQAILDNLKAGMKLNCSIKEEIL